MESSRGNGEGVRVAKKNKYLCVKMLKRSSKDPECEAADLEESPAALT